MDQSSSDASSAYFCPQCGARRSHAAAGLRGQHVCENCGTTFAVGQKKVPSDTQLPHGLAAAVPHGLAAQLTGKYRNVVIAVVLALVAAVFLLPLLMNVNKTSRPAAVQSKGRADFSALYEAAGKFSRVDVYKRRTEESLDEFRIEVSDMQSGAALSEPQFYRFPWIQHGGEFRNFSDGNLYLQLKEAMVLRFDPGASQFVDLGPQLMAQFPRELGGGMAEIKFAYKDRPDCLSVVANDGRKFYVYWLAGQILDADNSSRLDAQRAASASQSRKYYQFAPLYGGSSSDRRFLLVQYWNKYEEGQPEYLSFFELKPLPEGPQTGRSDQAVGGGYAVSAHVMEGGLQRLEVIEPTPRFHADIMAENATRLLLSYSATPEEGKGRVLQLLDKQSNQIVWSRDVAQIPLLARERGGIYTRAQALPSGFFMQGSSLEPGYLMDNQGALVREFAWR